MHNGNSTPFFQYHLQFLQFIRDFKIALTIKSQHEVVEVTAKLDSYTLNKNKHPSSD